MLKIEAQDRETLVEPLFRAGPGFYALVLFLLAVIGWGGFVYLRQITQGLAVTGMQRPAYWGVYMVNFVFFIGISHAGTLISAILRVTQAEWRRPITRIAEAITVVALVVGTFQILFDMGRPDRLLLMFRYGRLQSPLLWDMVSVTLYFLGSVTYFYLPLIADVAILRDNLPTTAPAWRRRLYNVLALGWRGNRTQWLRLERVIAVMAIIIIPIAVSVHTIISWILATTLQPGWHSTVFGPYFVVGAIFSGIGALFIAMTVMRWAFRLEAYITEKQYRYLGYLLIAMTLIWFYFTYTEAGGRVSRAGQQALGRVCAWLLAHGGLDDRRVLGPCLATLDPRTMGAGTGLSTPFHRSYSGLDGDGHHAGLPAPDATGHRRHRRRQRARFTTRCCYCLCGRHWHQRPPLAQATHRGQHRHRLVLRGGRHVAGALEHHRAHLDPPAPDRVGRLHPDCHGMGADGGVLCSVRLSVPDYLQALPACFHLGSGGRARH
jgi:Ni/Fe-hydrogenase subunit HybB-like protein